jgi:hypothetical protein
VSHFTHRIIIILMETIEDLYAAFSSTAKRLATPHRSHPAFTQSRSPKHAQNSLWPSPSPVEPIPTTSRDGIAHCLSGGPTATACAAVQSNRRPAGLAAPGTRSALGLLALTLFFMTHSSQGKKSPADAGLVCSKGTLTTATLFVAAVLLTLTGRLVLLCRCLLLATALTAGRGLVGALVLLSGRLSTLARRGIILCAVGRNLFCLFLVTSGWRLRGVKRPPTKQQRRAAHREPWPATPGLSLKKVSRVSLAKTRTPPQLP